MRSGTPSNQGDHLKLDTERAQRLADVILASLGREFPNKQSHVLASAADLAGPRRLHPSFFGCFDWHSAVHMHWSLVRLLRLFPKADFRDQARSVLDASLCTANLEAELEFRKRHPGHELPYGVAWLLTLQAELELAEPQWADNLRPLTSLASEHFGAWLGALPCPIRSGEHSQSAFAMRLVLDAAGILGNEALAQAIGQRALEFYRGDRDAPIAYEPSAYDFLSPCLAEADLLRRVLAPDAFCAWYRVFLPGLSLEPVSTADRTSGKLAHWDGLNLSRSWMLSGIASALIDDEAGRQRLQQSARAHLAAGLQGLEYEHYATSHWLPSFALYALGAH